MLTNLSEVKINVVSKQVGDKSEITYTSTIQSDSGPTPQLTTFVWPNLDEMVRDFMLSQILVAFKDIKKKTKVSHSESNNSGGDINLSFNLVAQDYDNVLYIEKCLINTLVKFNSMGQSVNQGYIKGKGHGNGNGKKK